MITKITVLDTMIFVRAASSDINEENSAQIAFWSMCEAHNAHFVLTYIF
jgi:hypothetical protein